MPVYRWSAGERVGAEAEAHHWGVCQPWVRRLKSYPLKLPG